MFVGVEAVLVVYFLIRELKSLMQQIKETRGEVVDLLERINDTIDRARGFVEESRELANIIEQARELLHVQHTAVPYYAQGEMYGSYSPIAMNIEEACPYYM